jgi:hypothetical protein
MDKAAIFIGILAACTSCASSRDGYFIRSTGLDKCILKDASFVAGETSDMTRIKIRPQSACKERMIKSIQVAAGASCSALVVDKKGCYYNFRGNSVMINVVGADSYVISVYK